ncbi:MAG TPA: hypothetical protein VJM32_03795 [Candidatus Saccharimonadales bacterium]|nr:hypothetical protein [Candidatus Saccharimonadales bacterium]
MTQTSAELVVGWVERFDPERGFGFVSPLLKDAHPAISNMSTVFIHADRCRAFTGVPEQAGISTARPSPEWVAQNTIPGMGKGGSRNRYSYVVMCVEPGTKGPRATRWAVIPRRNTVEDILLYGGLERYIGMDVAVLPAKTSSPDALWGTLTAWSLTDTRLQATLAAPRLAGGARMDEPSVTREFDFTSLRVADDDPSQLVLRLAHDESVTDVVCWRRPPL